MSWAIGMTVLSDRKLVAASDTMLLDLRAFVRLIDKLAAPVVTA